jgi:Domain of unknown function (DUF3943)
MIKQFKFVIAGVLLFLSAPLWAQELFQGSMFLDPQQVSQEYSSDETGAIQSNNEPAKSNKPPETSLLPRYNDLPRDDPYWNPRYSILIPILEVPATNGLIWSYDHYVAQEPFSNISGDTIHNNFKSGWVWDTDDFPTNFSLHPYSGSAYFNTARANGYGFYESAPFVLGGSLMWEMFMERTRPSYNDLINTTASGIFLGEVLYRLSSSFLDDRTTGGQRVFREIMGVVVDPVRGFNRLVQGKMFRVVDQDVYQKEPLSVTVAAGVRGESGIDTSSLQSSALINLNLSYGDPYEERARRPFDYFKLRAELGSGNIKHIATNVIGDGYLFGGNISGKKMLIGGFQHYDYWNNKSFEVGTIALGGGVIWQLPISKIGIFQNELHLAGVPLGASNTRIVPNGDVNFGFQNYTYSGGVEMKYEAALNFPWVRFASEYYLYWLHTYVGKPGDNFLRILRPRVSLKVYRDINLGYEFLLYSRTDYNPNAPDLRVRTQEQRLYVLFRFENF